MNKRILFYVGVTVAIMGVAIYLLSNKNNAKVLEPNRANDLPAYTGKAMQGIPASAESQVTLMNAFQQPYSKWAFRNAGVFPVLMVPRAGDIYKFPEQKNNTIENYKVPGTNGTTVLDAFVGDDTDGIIVIKDGVIRYEKYFGDFKANNLHVWASSTKSLVAMVAGVMVEEGKLDLTKTVEEYLPEMKGSAFDGLTLQQVLNMVSAIDYSEDYVDLRPGTVHYEYLRRVGLAPAFDLMTLDPRNDDTPRGSLGFLPQLQQHKDKTPGEVFEYHSPNVDVIGLIMSRESNKSLEEILSEYVWEKLGAEHDAQIMTDAAFNPIATGGFMSTLRDFAKFGYAVLNDGEVNGKQIFSKNYIDETFRLSDEDYAAGQRSLYRNDKDAASYDKHLEGYKNFWWVHDSEQQIMMARGVFGQGIYIDKTNNVIIATFGSAPTASNATRDTHKVKIDAMKLIADVL